jgi:hypothetical protein
MIMLQMFPASAALYHIVVVFRVWQKARKQQIAL